MTMPLIPGPDWIAVVDKDSIPTLHAAAALLAAIRPIADRLRRSEKTRARRHFESCTIEISPSEIAAILAAVDKAEPVKDSAR